ncbi:ATP-binding response regulator [Aliikangiella coralliicola]|uniref:histidine kinase n=1 Tax=Aliikangiella coralliicola TaxID=2592383 RepID=A0A545TW33_9GAMM|nr:response regulator [Aliikangiella coralliicola]TQV81437.1 response regulator [Aliikangiella coralliicola]
MTFFKLTSCFHKHLSDKVQTSSIFSSIEFPANILLSILREWHFDPKLLEIKQKKRRLCIWKIIERLEGNLENKLMNAAPTILIVDDEPNNLNLLKQVLAPHNYHLIFAKSGPDAIMRASQQEPDLVLLDVMMPGMDGYEVCQKLKSQPETEAVPVIFLTALDGVKDEQRGFDIGAVDYIVKPIVPALVLARVATQLDLRTRTQKLEKALTEIERANKELRDTQEQLVLQQMMAALGGTVAGVAHEINTPLGNSLFMTSALADKTNDFKDAFQSDTLKRSTVTSFLDDVQSSTDLILRNLHRSSKLIKRFKETAADRQGLTRRKFELFEFISESEPLLKRHAQGIEIDVKCQLKLTMQSYPDAIYRVLAQIIENASSHAFKPEQKGQVSIEVTAADEKVLIKVTDNGQGIDPELIDHIFEPFTTTKRGSATHAGLGLNVVFNTVTMVLAGDISVSSELKKGAEFTITIPQEVPEQVKVAS